MKKVLSVSLSVILLCSMLLQTSPVFASEIPTETASSASTIIEYSEFDAISKLKSMTDNELLNEGFTPEEIIELRDFSYEAALLERASYSDDALYAIGYNSDQIKLLREYDGSPITDNSPVLAATAVCTGMMHFYSYGSYTSEIKFYYSFNWSVQPLYGYTDYIGISYKAINPNAYYIDANATYKYVAINYYSTTTGNFYETDNALEIKSIDTLSGFYASYPNTKEVPWQPDDTVAVWAKSGYFWLALEPNGDNTIDSVKAFGAVGHKVRASSQSIGFSIGSNAAFSFSYTPSTVYETCGEYPCLITKGGNVSRI